MTITTSAKKTAILATLRTMHSEHPEIGLVRDIKDLGGEKIVLVIHDTPFVNVSIQKVIAVLIDRLVKLRFLSLVGCDGSSGEIDTGWLKDIRYQEFRDSIIDSLLESGKLTGLEYCHIYSSTPFVLLGTEDKKMYDQAAAVWEKLTPLRNFLDEEKTERRIREAMNIPKLKPLFDDFQEFLKLDQRRANVMVNNILRTMKEMDIEISALICRGNLPEYVVKDLSQRGISYVIIDPARAADDDKKTYEKIFEQQRKLLKKSDG